MFMSFNNDSYKTNIVRFSRELLSHGDRVKRVHFELDVTDVVKVEEDIDYLVKNLPDVITIFHVYDNDDKLVGEFYGNYIIEGLSDSSWDGEERHVNLSFQEKTTE